MFWRLYSCDSGQWRCPLKSYQWWSWGWSWPWGKHVSQFSASLDTFRLSFVLALLPVPLKFVLNSRVRCAFSNVFFYHLSMEWTGEKDICGGDGGDPIQSCGGAICERSNSFKLWWSGCHAPSLCRLDGTGMIAAFLTEYENQQMQIITSVCILQRVLHYESGSKSEDGLFCFSRYLQPKIWLVLQFIQFMMIPFTGLLPMHIRTRYGTTKICCKISSIKCIIEFCFLLFHSNFYTPRIDTLIVRPSVYLCVIQRKRKYLSKVLDLSIIIGPESDHWECLSLTDSLTHSLTNSLLFSKLDWCDPGVWRCQLKTCWGFYCCWCW